MIILKHHNDKIFIVTITLNDFETIEQTIKSIINQIIPS